MKYYRRLDVQFSLHFFFVCCLNCSNKVLSEIISFEKVSYCRPNCAKKNRLDRGQLLPHIWFLALCGSFNHLITERVKTTVAVYGIKKRSRKYLETT